MGIFDFILKQGSSIEAGGQLADAISHVQFGRDQRRAAEFKAAQLRANASDAAASGQFAAAEAERQSRIVASRALAVAAASGGGASDPGVVNVISGIAAEGAYRQAVALYEGFSKRDDLMLDAEATTYEGKLRQARATGEGLAKIVRTGATVVKNEAKTRDLLSKEGGDTMLAKYGAGGPKLGGGDVGVTDPGLAPTRRSRSGWRSGATMDLLDRGDD